MEGIEQDDMGKAFYVFESCRVFFPDLDGAEDISGTSGLDGHALAVLERCVNGSDGVEVEIRHDGMSWVVDNYKLLKVGIHNDGTGDDFRVGR
jgi:hypothetical protein